MRLLRLAWNILVGVKDMLVLLAMLLFFALLYTVFTASPNPAVPGSGALNLDLDGVIVEQPAEVDPFAVLAGASDTTKEHRLRDLIRALEAAASDDRIKLVALDLDGFLGGGASAIGETGDAIQAVRDAGKPVIAYATAYTDDSYALAAHASEVWLDPMGFAAITGPGGSGLYFAELIERLGITANVFRVGDYKAAVEPFTRSDQSPESREADQALADTLFEAWRGDVERARPRARLAGFIAEPAARGEAAGTLAEAARGAGLVDRIGDRSEWGERIAAIAGADEEGGPGGFRAIALDNWIAANPSRSSGEKIGVLTVAGVIVDGEAGPGTAGGETIAKLMHKALAEHELKALVVRIDSPGGSALASEQIRQSILEARERGIPVVVSMGSLAASGGYWVATAGQRIIAEPATITGSIGVFGIIPTFEGTLDQIGVGVDGVATTPLSGEPDLAGGLSPEAAALFQAGVEDVYRRFIAISARARDMPPARLNEIAQGRVWAGATARQLGLIDGFGSLDDAIAEAARLARIDPDNVRPVWIETEPSAAAQFVRGWFTEEPAEQARNPWARLFPSPGAIIARAAADARLILEGPSIQARCLACPVKPAASLAREDAALFARLLRASGLWR